MTIVKGQRYRLYLYIIYIFTVGINEIFILFLLLVQCTFIVKISKNQSRIKFDINYLKQKKKKLSTSKKLHLNIKDKLGKTYVWNSATYGCETWVVNDAEKKNLEALGMWRWRRMERISWMERKN